MSRPAIFLDRDGTMIEEVNYLSRLDDVRWLPGTIEAIRLFRRAGYLVCVVTNQSGIARGMFDEAFVRRVHAAMEAEVVEAGGGIDGWYFCPHHPNGTVAAFRGACDCRKPGRGMIDAACRDHAIDLTRSWVIGDRDLDLGLAAAVGARGALVRTGYGERHAAHAPAGTLIVADLMEAAAEVLTS
jgi:D-glycero-D-manno-heptose 1,7-bisphosphate phosphatase